MVKPAADTPRAAPRALDQRELRRFPGYLLARSRYVAFKAFESAVRESCNLRPVEFSVLLLLEHNPEATQTQLSQALGVAPPNMTGLLRRLEGRQLLTRERGASDARQQHLRLTAEGRALLTAALSRVRSADKSWMNRLSRGEQAMLLELLEKLVDGPAA